MELIALTYNSKDGTSKDLLLIYLGEYDNKIVGVDTATVNEEERAFIMKNAHQIESMPIKMVVKWLQSYCPIAYRSGFKTLLRSRSKIISRHKIKISV